MERRQPIRYGSIGVELDKLAELRAVKQEWERRSGRSFRWGDFLMMLVTLHQAADTVESLPQQEVAEMHQHETVTEEQLAQMGVYQDDALTLEVAALTGGRAALSEETVDAIATKVAESVVRQLKA